MCNNNTSRTLNQSCLTFLNMNALTILMMKFAVASVNENWCNNDDLDPDKNFISF